MTRLEKMTDCASSFDGWISHHVPCYPAIDATYVFLDHLDQVGVI